jgi:ubiquinone/menaquinone biosynthesis C-methylase UbiE
MKDTILRTNAIPVYGFLSYIHAHRENGEQRQKKVLDCGAGGPVPPVALFAQHGFDAWGIDISDSQLEKAKAYCTQNEINVHLQKGDMRQIPFNDQIFDYIFEQYAMCHLIKREIAQAIGEMHRVIKKGGLCFLGAISSDSFPKLTFGKEKAPGEYYGKEGEDFTPHSIFAEKEFEDLLTDWEVLNKEKHIKYIQGVERKPSLDEWMNSYEEAGRGFTREDWRKRYETHKDEMQYVHLFYILRKK